MEEEQDPTPQYIKAFNNGYTLQQHEPQLMEQIVKSDSKQEQMIAIKAGAQQYLRDKTRQKQDQIRDKKQERTRKR